ncbi:MAG: Hsp20/alpha crystallin family protein [Patescibacteria group bacterium]|jgi:HSP20 family protein|nr:Hsp20/alpha crystallin family protein [Patescibacteria group bacterium]
MLFTKKRKNNKKPEEIETNIDTNNDYFWSIDEQDQVEGQLAIDVFQINNNIIIKSTVAGVNPEDLKISLHNDLLTIKGVRKMKDSVSEKDYLYQECYWGSFSRSIILPAEVDSQKVEAEIENGILTITLTKTEKENIEVRLKE